MALLAFLLALMLHSGRQTVASDVQKAANLGSPTIVRGEATPDALFDAELIEAQAHINDGACALQLLDKQLSVPSGYRAGGVPKLAEYRALLLKDQQNLRAAASASRERVAAASEETKDCEDLYEATDLAMRAMARAMIDRGWSDKAVATYKRSIALSSTAGIDTGGANFGQSRSAIGRLGDFAKLVPAALRRYYGLDPSQSARRLGVTTWSSSDLSLASVTVGSPANLIGLQDDDVIQVIENQPVVSLSTFYATLKVLTGNKVSITVSRNGQPVTYTTTVPDTLP